MESKLDRITLPDGPAQATAHPPPPAASPSPQLGAAPPVVPATSDTTQSGAAPPGASATPASNGPKVVDVCGSTVGVAGGGRRPSVMEMRREVEAARWAPAQRGVVGSDVRRPSLVVGLQSDGAGFHGCQLAAGTVGAKRAQHIERIVDEAHVRFGKREVTLSTWPTLLLFIMESAERAKLDGAAKKAASLNAAKRMLDHCASISPEVKEAVMRMAPELVDAFASVGNGRVRVNVPSVHRCCSCPRSCGCCPWLSCCNTC